MMYLCGASVSPIDEAEDELTPVLLSEQHERTTKANLRVIRRLGPSRRLPVWFSNGGCHGRHARKAGRFGARVYFCVARRHLHCAYRCAPSTG